MIYKALLCAALAVLCVIQTEAALAAMSIDFGTQFIKIGLVKPGVPMEVVLNKESRRKTPNVMVIRNDARFFAESAAALAVKFPTSSYQYLLELLAKKDGSPLIELYKKRFPFASISFDETRGTVIFPSESEKHNVETLLAMILWSCKQDAKAFAEQSVKDVVITVPTYFNQAERKAMVAAAKISGLNLLQLLNDGSAAALNYGVFRRKEITEQPQTMMIYDMGAAKTTATLVEYLLQEDKIRKEKNPVVRTIGVGFDRSLGGLEMTKRLQDHLEDVFRKTHKTPTDIAKTPRSMAKLFKEAERVKQVLSANTDHFAQIENVHEDVDFRTKVTRAEFEDLISDLEPRIAQPIKDALAMAEMTINQVDQFVLMGAGTRVPKVQAIIQKELGEKEIGRFLNTDEAIALGAVYQAADLSKSFRVLPFRVQEIQLYPIHVNFQTRNESTGEIRDVSRAIFGFRTHYPAPKKTISFTSYKDDFSFSLAYGPLSYLGEKQISEFGTTDLASVTVTGLGDTINNQTTVDGAIYKGVKAQFAVDLSGIVSVVKAEAVIEIPPSIDEVEKINAETDAGNQTQPDNKEGGDVEKEEKLQPNETDSTKDDKLEGDKKEEKKEENSEQVPKAKSVKTKLSIHIVEKDVVSFTEEASQNAIDRLMKFEQIEKEKAEREASMNALEAQIYDLAAKIEDGEEFSEYCTQSEKDKLKEETSRLRTWMEEDVDMNTKTEEFLANKKILDDASQQPLYRKKEKLEIPRAVEALDEMFNHSRTLLVVAQNLTGSDDPVFTTIELEVLTKLVSETESWWLEKQLIYVKQEKNEDPAVTTRDIAEKIRDLDREVKYLVNKMRLHIPKKKEDLKKEDTENKEENSEGTNKTENKEESDDIKKEGDDTKDNEKAPSDEAQNDETTHDAAEF